MHVGGLWLQAELGEGSTRKGREPSPESAGVTAPPSFGLDFTPGRPRGGLTQFWWLVFPWLSWEAAPLSSMLCYGLHIEILFISSFLSWGNLHAWFVRTGEFKPCYWNTDQLKRVGTSRETKLSWFLLNGLKSSSVPNKHCKVKLIWIITQGRGLTI